MSHIPIHNRHIFIKSRTLSTKVKKLYCPHCGALCTPVPLVNKDSLVNPPTYCYECPNCRKLGHIFNFVRDDEGVKQYMNGWHKIEQVRPDLDVMY